ncbi:CelD/BcsL family acetyltransferase involved in cellulose biosynthesis [Rhizobium aquaticum]|uniref:CelD/BcsL family acetyltransferase involved in cellulose biosynthesis n=1 Tax=Rhizobium aquaticum TaxID=1549636 RepID=A0ABV2J543_9HYPH
MIDPAFPHQAVSTGTSADLAEDLVRETRKIDIGRPGRALYFYDAQAGFELQGELDYLSNRALEANVFFSGQFLAPALPRLEEKQIRLAVLRDTDGRKRARFLMPFSVERPGLGLGSPIIRVWANHFAPLGTPLIDAEEAAESVDNVFEALGSPDAGLPQVLVIPDVKIDRPAAQLIRALALGRNLPIAATDQRERPMLESLLDGETYMSESLSAKHNHEMRRQWRKLSEKGEVTYNVARQPRDVVRRMEEFLLLEASGWKGKEKTALTIDRLRSAFAREAIYNLAQADKVRIHTIDLDGQAIASLIVFLSAGEAYTWKTAYNEAYADCSPGKILMSKVTEWHLDDANIVRTDSLAVPDHPVMSRLWRERDAMATLIIGLSPGRDRDVRQIATQLHLYQNTRDVARKLRDRIMSLRGRS